MKPLLRFSVMLLILIFGCSPMMLKPADFSWPVESVLKVDGKGNVRESRYQLSFNVKALLFEETRDSLGAGNVTMRIIRDMAGYYYMTAPRFKHVYVFETAEGGMRLVSKILVSEEGMESPAFNARSHRVQLLNGNNKPRMLTKSGFEEGGGE